ncbi:MAG: Clp protease N-terminal domain-containing protein [Thermomicrobiales bacterium]
MATIRSLNSELFTIDATVSLVTASRIAGDHQTVTPEHLLLALLEPSETRLRKALDLFHIDLERIQQLAGRRLAEIQRGFGPPGQLDGTTEQVIHSAFGLAGHLRRDITDDIHLFMGILTLGPGSIAGDLHDLGLSVGGFRSVVVQFTRDHAYSIARLRETGLNVGEADQLVEELFVGSSVNLEAIVEEKKRIDRVSRIVNSNEFVISSPGRAKHQSIRTSGVRRLLAVTRPSPIFLSLVAAFLVSGVFLAFRPSADFLKPFIILFIISGWFVSLCLHEYGHAAAAYIGGDDSVQYAGYLTLNPLKYTNPLFSIALPLAFLAMGGVPLPGGAVMIQTWKLRSRQAELAVSAAGPFANVIFIISLSLPFALNLPERFPQLWDLWFAMAGLLAIETFVLILNLLPIPPLDGFNILSYWLSYETQNTARSLGYLTLFLLYAMLWSSNPISDFLYSTVDAYLRFIQLDPAIAWYAWSYLRF